MRVASYEKIKFTDERTKRRLNFVWKRRTTLESTIHDVLWIAMFSESRTNWTAEVTLWKLRFAVSPYLITLYYLITLNRLVGRTPGNPNLISINLSINGHHKNSSFFEYAIFIFNLFCPGNFFGKIKKFHVENILIDSGQIQYERFFRTRGRLRRKF